MASPKSPMPEEIKRPPESITLWVIYDHPLDYAGFVLRPQFSAKRMEDSGDFSEFGRVTEDHGKAVVIVSRLAWYAATADELRAILPPGCFPLGRQPDDDPVIAEIWMDPS